MAVFANNTEKRMSIPFEKSALQIVSDSPVKLILTGSRRFGTSTERSDWDFFTEDSPSVREQFMEVGFRKLPMHDYLDITCNAVFRKENVDIQFRSEIRSYEAVCLVLERLGKDFYIALSNRSIEDRQAWWNMQLEIFQAVQKTIFERLSSTEA